MPFKYFQLLPFLQIKLLSTRQSAQNPSFSHPLHTQLLIENGLKKISITWRAPIQWPEEAKDDKGCSNSIKLTTYTFLYISHVFPLQAPQVVQLSEPTNIHSSTTAMCSLHSLASTHRHIASNGSWYCFGHKAYRGMCRMGCPPQDILLR